MSNSADIAVGMMDHAYFVGRVELLEFLNDLLDLQLAKIEQTASGAVACQLTEYIFPGSIPMQKVNWEARSDYEFIANYKLLQAAFSKNRVQRHVDVTKLIRAKYQDNLEFCQWLKAFFDQAGVIRENYDPSAVRAKGKGGKKYNTFLEQTASKHGSRPLPKNRSRPTGTTTPRAAGTTRATTPSSAKRTTTPAKARVVTTRPSPAKKVPLRENYGGLNKTGKGKVDTELAKKNAEMEKKISELETAVIELEKERDFYFGKLRNVELMLQVQQDKNFEGSDLDAVVENIFKVLYATADEDVNLDEDGDVLPADEPADELNETAASAVSVPAQESEVF